MRETCGRPVDAALPRMRKRARRCVRAIESDADALKAMNKPGDLDSLAAGLARSDDSAAILASIRSESGKSLRSSIDLYERRIRGGARAELELRFEGALHELGMAKQKAKVARCDADAAREGAYQARERAQAQREVRQAAELERRAPRWADE